MKRRGVLLRAILGAAGGIGWWSGRPTRAASPPGIPAARRVAGPASPDHGAPHVPRIGERVPTSFVIDGRDGDFMLPGLGERSFAVRAIRLRAGGGLTAVTVAPKLVTEGAAARHVAMADAEGPLAARIIADASPVVLEPTRNNVVAGAGDLRGTRFPLFALTRSLGRGRLEVTLELEPVAAQTPRFARPAAVAADFAQRPPGGRGVAWRRAGAGSVAALADPLFGGHAVARCIVSGTGEAGVELAAGGAGAGWFYAAFRLWDVPADVRRLGLLRASDADGRDVFRLDLRRDGARNLAAGDASFGLWATLGADAHLDERLGPVGAHWPDDDAAAVPRTTAFLPVLVHYTAKGALRLWVRELAGPPSIVVAPAPDRGVTRLCAGIIEMKGGSGTVDLLAPRLWPSDPRTA